MHSVSKQYINTGPFRENATATIGSMEIFLERAGQKNCKMPNMFHRINTSYTGWTTNMPLHLNGDRVRLIRGRKSYRCF